MGEVILIASGKGGTGKTVFTANMGALLAKRGKKVILVDMDMGLRNLDLYMGLESKIVYNVMDVLSGVCGIKKAMVRDKRFDQLYIMAASPNKDGRDITPLHMEILCEKLKKDFDYVLIDEPAGMDDGLTNTMGCADKVVLITEAEFAAIRDAETVDNYLQKHGVKNRFYVVNKVRADLMATELVPSLENIASSIRTKMIGIIQYDDNIYISTNRGIPIILKKNTYIEKNFNKILDRLINE